MLGSRRGRDKFRPGATIAEPPGFAGAKTTTDKVTGLLSDKVGISPTWSGQVDRLRSGQAGQVSTGHYERRGKERNTFPAGPESAISKLTSRLKVNRASRTGFDRPLREKSGPP